MAARSVFVVGDSLFADALKQTLTDNSVAVLGSAPTPEAALHLLGAMRPDAVILANASADPAPAVVGQFLAAYPDLPIICANLSANVIQVVASQRVGPHSSDLLAAISALPKRS